MTDPVEQSPEVHYWSATQRLPDRHCHTVEHSFRVMGYAVQLAERLELDATLVSEIRVASLLHDIGKQAIPARILNKPDALTPDEWRLIRLHPRIGSGMATSLGYNESVRAMVLHHHEHWDGSGYPTGLQAVDIPVGARVIAMADVFDALTSPRSYRSALDARTALGVMRAEAGTILDPFMFLTFRALVR
ncbi:MAG TPA: HD-GYP domain-containing protein, partial [Longimicrobiales bacterium]|nr:HD-GYP domain-containing protein [Longimicrobiales bacterium]